MPYICFCCEPAGCFFISQLATCPDAPKDTWRHQSPLHETKKCHPSKFKTYKVKLAIAPAPSGSTAMMPAKKHAHQRALQGSLTREERNLEQDLTVIPAQWSLKNSETTLSFHLIASGCMSLWTSYWMLQAADKCSAESSTNCQNCGTWYNDLYSAHLSVTRERCCSWLISTVRDKMKR